MYSAMNGQSSGHFAAPLVSEMCTSTAHASCKEQTRSLFRMVLQSITQKAADVWKKDVWDFQAFSQSFFELRVSLGNEGEDGKSLNSQTWPGSPRRPSPRHPRPQALQLELDDCKSKSSGMFLVIDVSPLASWPKSLYIYISLKPSINNHLALFVAKFRVFSLSNN